MSESSVRRLVGQQIDMNQVLETEFKNSIQKRIDKEDFSFQYSFRKSSIAQIFNKELISTIIFLVCLIYINIQCSLTFDYGNFNPFTDSIKLFKKLETNEIYWRAVAFDCYKNETLANPKLEDLKNSGEEAHYYIKDKCLA